MRYLVFLMLVGCTSPDPTIPLEECEELGCGDCNPCTVDRNCTPCSTLPEEDREDSSCTPDADIASVCGTETGCIHEDLEALTKAKPGCYPIADNGPLRAGVCNVGVCTGQVAPRD